jgi:hypothetical protein
MTPHYTGYSPLSQVNYIYEGSLQSSEIHIITQNRNFVEVRWLSLLRSTSLGKQCTSYNAPPTSWKRAADRWSLRNLSRSSLFMVGKAHKSHRMRFELNSVFGLEKVERWNSIRTFAIQSRPRPMRFLGFSNHEKGAPRQEILKWSTVCSTFSRSGWSVVITASLAKGDTSKKRPSPHLHKVPTRSDKVSPQTFQTTLVCVCVCMTFRELALLQYSDGWLSLHWKPMTMYYFRYQWQQSGLLISNTGYNATNRCWQWKWCWPFSLFSVDLLFQRGSDNRVSHECVNYWMGSGTNSTTKIWGV